MWHLMGKAESADRRSVTNGSTVSMAICTCLTPGARTPVTLVDGYRNLMASRGEKELTKHSDTRKSRKNERKRGPISMTQVMYERAIALCSVARTAKAGAGKDGPPGAEANSTALEATGGTSHPRSLRSAVRAVLLQSSGANRLRGISPGLITKHHSDFL